MKYFLISTAILMLALSNSYSLAQSADSAKAAVPAVTFSGYAELYYVRIWISRKRRNDPVFCIITSGTGRLM
jgi:hypothetical protein